MRSAKTSNYIGQKRFDIDSHLTNINKDLENLFLILQSRVRFGTGTDGDGGENIEGEFQVITTNGSVDTEDAFAHTLGSVPVGYIVLKQDKAGSIYEGTTSWTSSNIYLRSDVASVTATIFVLR